MRMSGWVQELRIEYTRCCVIFQFEFPPDFPGAIHNPGEVVRWDGEMDPPPFVRHSVQSASMKLIKSGDYFITRDRQTMMHIISHLLAACSGELHQHYPWGSVVLHLPHKFLNSSDNHQWILLFAPQFSLRGIFRSIILHHEQSDEIKSVSGPHSRERGQPLE